MGARQKLNQAYVTGSLVLAVIAGWITDSAVVFVLTAITLLALNVSSGDIRMTKK